MLIHTRCSPAEADARSAPLSGPLFERVNHPASFGWTAFILGDLRPRAGLALASKRRCNKITGMPAAKFRLPDRGLLRPGMAADVVVFDPRAIRDNASFEEPRRSPDGIRAVYVNGVLTVDAGRHTGAVAGGVIRG